MTIRPLLAAALAASLLWAAAPARALDAAEMEGVFTLRFAKVSKAFTAAKDSLPAASREKGETILARAARSAAEKGYTEADGDLDAVEALLAEAPKAEAQAAPKKKEKAPKKEAKAKGKPKKAAPAPEPEPADAPDEAALPAEEPRESSLPAVEFTLEDAFRPKDEPAKAAAAEETGPPPKEAPKLKKFDVKNLDPEDRRNMGILNNILPQVEAVFKKHPNPETAEAMKQTRRFIYYLKKRACGYPPERETDDEMALFIKSRIKKVRVVDR